MNILTDEYLPEFKKKTGNILAGFPAQFTSGSDEYNFEYYLESSAVYSSNIEGNSIAGQVYLAIEPEKVKAEIKKLFDDIKYLKQRNLSVKEIFYYALFIHLIFAQIHPFMEGNGRAARLLEKWFLSAKPGESAWKVSSEKYCFENRSRYYRNINPGQNYYELNYKNCLPF